MTERTTPSVFKYKPNYVAAWPDAASEALLRTHGVCKMVHLTTFFDGYGQMTSVTPYPWQAPQAARITAVVEWQIGNERYLVAEFADCTWSREVNDFYHAQGVREDLPHKPHATLRKGVAPGTEKSYQRLVGQVICFDRHGGPVDDRPLG